MRLDIWSFWNYTLGGYLLSESERASLHMHLCVHVRVTALIHGWGSGVLLCWFRGESATCFTAVVNFALRKPHSKLGKFSWGLFAWYYVLAKCSKGIATATENNRLRQIRWISQLNHIWRSPQKANWNSFSSWWCLAGERTKGGRGGGDQEITLKTNSQYLFSVVSFSPNEIFQLFMINGHSCIFPVFFDKVNIFLSLCLYLWPWKNC